MSIDPNGVSDPALQSGWGTMTIEEASERIIKGGQWERCVSCNGVGATRESMRRYKQAVMDRERVGRLAPEAGVYLEDCRVCDGLGSYLDPTYVAACQVVGMDPPIHPKEWNRLLRSRQKRL